MSATRQAIAKRLLVLALLWGFIGCAYPPKRAEPQPPPPPPAVVESAPEFIWEIPAERVLPPPPPSKPKPRPYVHEVRYSGEILISIAKWYTGSRNNWTAIAKANPHLNPNRIFIGDKILIPENLLKRRDPMPKLAPYVHTVRWLGENISIIAQWYTGSGKNWNTIAKANPKIKSNHIIVGDKVIIPENLLKRRDPMPLNFLVTSSRKKSAQTLPPKQPSVESYAIELFNPEITEQPSTESDTIPLFEPLE
jgi:hypothetical protein